MESTHDNHNAKPIQMPITRQLTKRKGAICSCISHLKENQLKDYNPIYNYRNSQNDKEKRTGGTQETRTQGNRI
jgi:hypothetical protein